MQHNYAAPQHRTTIHIYAAHRRQQRTAHREHLYNLNTPVTYQLHISYISPAHIVLIYIMNKYI